MDFSSSVPSGKISVAQREQITDQVKSQIAVLNAQELLQKLTDKCFKKCIYNPGTSLSNSDKKCVAMCMDRYMDTWNHVSHAYNMRLTQERDRM